MPGIPSEVYQHPLDKKALNALQSIPAFPAFMKAFMKAWNERLMFIESCSSHIQLSERQLPEIYELLPPICEKLDIPVPYLYLSYDITVNASTTNESDPLIVLNAGLLERCSTEDLRGVIAHECGHIACHHVLYRQVGSMIFGGSSVILSGSLVGKLLTAGLEYAFYEWMRTSELSADRAAALALGGSKPTVHMLTMLAGAYENLNLNIDYEVFLEQAAAYEQAITASFTDSLMEGLMYGARSHPLNAYRALEVTRWCTTPEFAHFQDVLNGRAPAIDPAVVAQAAAAAATSAPSTQFGRMKAAFTGKGQQVPVGNPGTAMPNNAGPTGNPYAAGPTNAAPVGGENKFCIHCGQPINPGSAFCANCGNRVG